MRVLHFLHGIQLGGITALVYNLSRESRRLGDDVAVCTLHDQRSDILEMRYPDFYGSPGIPLFRIGKRPGRDRIKTSLELASTLRRFQPDVVIIHHEHLQVLVLPYTTIHRIPVFQVIHNQVIEWVGFQRLFSRHLIRAYLFVSEAAKTNGIRVLHLPQEKALTVPNGIDCAEFPVGTQQPLSFLFVGRLVEQKNLDGLIERYRMFVQTWNGDDVPPLTIVGSGPQEAQLDATIHAHGLQNRITRISAHGNMADCYSQHSLLLLPSHYEGWPMVLLEAMSSGMALVAHNVGGVQELLGLSNPQLIDPNDPNAFVSAMVRLCQDPLYRHALQQENRQRAEHFSITQTALKYQRIFSGSPDKPTSYEESRWVLSTLLLPSFKEAWPQDPQTLLVFLNKQRLSALLAPMVSHHLSSDALKTSLRETQFLTIQRYFAYQTVQQEVHEHLRTKHIPHWFFKGLELCAHYPHPSQRAMKDLDLLVPPTDIQTTLDTLMSLGFSVEKVLLTETILIRHPIKVELHTQLLHEFDVGESLSDYFRLQTLPNLKTSGQCPLDHEDYALYLLIHFAKHMTSSGAGLRFLVDLGYFVRNVPLNFSLLKDRLATWGYDAFADVVWGLLDDWFNTDIGSSSTDFQRACLLHLLGEEGIFGYTGDSSLRAAMRHHHPSSDPKATKKALFHRLMDGFRQPQRVLQRALMILSLKKLALRRWKALSSIGLDITDSQHG